MPKIVRGLSALLIVGAIVLAVVLLVVRTSTDGQRPAPRTAVADQADPRTRVQTGPLSNAPANQSAPADHEMTTQMLQDAREGSLRALAEAHARWEEEYKSGRLFPARQGKDFGRNRYPRKVRDAVPGGGAARDFDCQTIAEIASLNLDRPTATQIGRRVELETMLAEVVAGVPEACRELVEAARSATGKSREVAILILGRIDSSLALRFLIDEALASPDLELRRTAVAALLQDQGWNVKQLGGGQTRGVDTTGPIANPGIVAALVAALQRESDPQLQRYMMTKLSIDLVEGSLDGQDGEADRAAHPQGLNFAREVLSAFETVLQTSTDPQIREQALRSIGVSQTPEAVDLLLSTAKTAPTVVERAQAIRSLPTGGRFRDDALSYAVEALGDQRPQLRQAAIEALRSAGRDEWVYGRLIEVSKKDPDSQTRLVAFYQALDNLLARGDRFRQQVTPEYARALDLLEESISGRAFGGPASPADLTALKQIARAVKWGRFQPTAEQAARLGRLQASARAANPPDPEVEKAREEMRGR